MTLAQYWQRCTRLVQIGTTALLVVLLLATCLAMLAYQFQSSAMLGLARWAAGGMALLTIAIAASITVMAGVAWVNWRHFGPDHKHGAHGQQLRRAIGKTAMLALWTWALALNVACLPMVMALLPRVPEVGWILLLLMIVFGLHRANAIRLTRQLAAAMADNQLTTIPTVYA